MPCEPAETVCVSCERDLRDARPVVEPGPPGLELTVAAARFEGVPRAVAHGLKFGRRLGLAEVAAGAMLRALHRAEPGAQSARYEVVPVPAAPWRHRWRGFDPAEEIALALARLAGLPYRPCLRRGHGARQVGRRRSQRVADPPRVWIRRRAPTEALLVDDVHTTGATLGACAVALRGAGCDRVVGLTLARVL
jgi:predicted amidophosphoribosyltransferase